MKKEVKFRPAYHTKGSIHCVDMIFILSGEYGAVTFVLFTGWHLPSVVEDIINRH